MPEPLTGEITTVLGALGQGIYDEGGLSLFGLAGATYEDDEFPGELYRTFTPHGIAVQYEGDDSEMLAQAVFVYLEARDGADPYPTPDGLIGGLPLSGASRDDVRAHLGEPERTADGFDAFAVDGRFLHVEYGTNGTVSMVTAMLELPGS
ncbi:hypothetical protein [Aeromicrobium sp. CTD01-1L150]|uniref:hypothetical protein n=1 Tax=Aeromicrobium sp. CTD01-1L150 TaxID=3341830 RepID=UPI0035C07D8F